MVMIIQSRAISNLCVGGGTDSSTETWTRTRKSDVGFATSLASLVHTASIGALRWILSPQEQDLGSGTGRIDPVELEESCEVVRSRLC